MVKKKEYIRPTALIHELVSEPLMLVVSGETDKTQVGNGTVGDETPDLVAQKRGEWGNLWAR